MILEKNSKEDQWKSICFWYEVNCKGQKLTEIDATWHFGILMKYIFLKIREIVTTVPNLAKHSMNMILEKISKEDQRKSICFWYEVNM